MKRVAAICALVTLLPGIALCDETFRCGTWVVTMPLSVSDLVQKCGQPSSKQVSTQDAHVRTAGGGNVKTGTTTEVWRYDRPGAPPMIVTIADGVIQSLERGQD
jgi:hypothetical protein